MYSTYIPYYHYYVESVSNSISFFSHIVYIQSATSFFLKILLNGYLGNSMYSVLVIAYLFFFTLFCSFKQHKCEDNEESEREK